jgi:ABC-type lipoprotein export system ATPase subunit
VNGLSEDQIKNIIGNYIYTQDNFIKVILILMRLRSKVPVIMMGETGCGKTALIRMAYNLKNKNKNK